MIRHSRALTICTEIPVKNFRQVVLVFFLASKTGTGLSCTIYKIPVNFPLSLDMKPGTSNPDKKKKISVVSVKSEYLERYDFFSGKFPPG